MCIWNWSFRNNPTYPHDFQRGETVYRLLLTMKISDKYQVGQITITQINILHASCVARPPTDIILTVWISALAMRLYFKDVISEHILETTFMSTLCAQTTNQYSSWFWRRPMIPYGVTRTHWIKYLLVFLRGECQRSVFYQYCTNYIKWK